MGREGRGTDGEGREDSLVGDFNGGLSRIGRGLSGIGR